MQTVLRQFTNRAGLIEAATTQALSQVTDEREAPVGDVDAALRVLVDHYELRGDASLLLLAQEGTDEQVAAITQHGRTLHRRWVQRVFAPYLGRDAGRSTCWSWPPTSMPGSCSAATAACPAAAPND